MDDLEQECEDAVLGVCDARERYPTLCANELGKILKLKNELSMAKVQIKPSKPLEIPSITKEQEDLINNYLLEINSTSQPKNSNLDEILHSIHNLMAVQEQIEREKSCPFNALLNS